MNKIRSYVGIRNIGMIKCINVIINMVFVFIRSMVMVVTME